MTKTIALGLVVLAAAACNPNAALKPKDGGVVTTVNAGSLPGIYIGALSDFQVAWSGAGNEANGGHEGNVGLSAIFTDELTAAGLDEFTFRRNLDSRQATPSNPQLAGIFNDLSGARHSTENAAADFAKFAPNDLGRAEMLALEGYTYIVFAEMWCTGIPFGELTSDGKPIYGTPLRTGQMDTIALQKFDSATALAKADTSNQTILALTQVGRARVLLDLGQFDAAGAAADSALAGDPQLVYQMENSLNSGRQFNGVWQFVQGNNAWGVVDKKGGNGLNFISAQDPRILWVDSHQVGSLGVDTPFFDMKYPTKNSSITLASATEATLISAERDLHDGNVSSWASKLNGLRAASGLVQTVFDTITVSPLKVDTLRGPLPALTADSTTGASDSLRVEVHFREREFWLWLTGTRLGDLRRLLNQTQYPQGQWGTHNDFPLNEPGSDVRFSVPVTEQNNPNFKQCGDVGHEQ